MSLTRVEVTSEVFWVCTNHALTTEAEEIMGLLLGDVIQGPGGEAVARIWIAMPQIRSDRRKDRVEASPEQLSRCALAAEQFTNQGGVRTRVIGWYHSHPHITVLPSHIDIKTQATYQMLDEGFVGLIFSVFNEDSRTKSQGVSVTAFQSVPADERLSPAPSLLAGRLPSIDADMAQAIQLSLAGKTKALFSVQQGVHPALLTHQPCLHIMQEARNSASADSVQWQRKGVPLHIVQSQGPMERTLTDLVALAKVLYQEEQKAFHAAMEEDTDREGNIDPLAAIQHGTLYQANLCRLMELVVAPMLASIQTCCSQQQLQKQFGHLGNSVYTMQMPAQSSSAQPAEQSVSQSLSTSMAELLEISDSSGGLGLTPSPSGSWNPSASLHVGKLQPQNQQQQRQPQSQPQVQQYLGEAQAQAGTQAKSQPEMHLHTHPQSQPESQHSQHDLFPADPQPKAPPYHQSQGGTSSADSWPPASQHHKSQGVYPSHSSAESMGEPVYLYDDEAGRQQAPPTSSSSELPSPAAHSSGAQPVNVSIITPAVWEPQDWQHAQHGSSPSHAQSTQQDQDYSASAPAASSDDLRAAYGSSPYQAWQHSPQQPLPETPLHFSSSLPIASSNSKRSIATNTHLTMHRGNSDTDRSNAEPASSPTASMPQAPLADQTVSQASGNYQPNKTGMFHDGGRAPSHSQMLQSRSSHSTNSLNVLPSMEGLERQSSGQTPMRAGSPALGGRSFPRPPAWSPKMHDPFSDLVQPDLRRAGSSHSNAGMS